MKILLWQHENDCEEMMVDTKIDAKSMVNVNVLGTKYTIMYCDGSSEKLLKQVDGFIDTSTKIIYIDNSQEATIDAKKDLEAYRKCVVRHEIIHAFLYESGLAENSNKADEWAVNEEMVDWLAIQMPKIWIACMEADCLR